MDMLVAGGWFTGVLSSLTSLLFLWSMVQQCVPDLLRDYVDTLATRIMDAISPYDTVTMDEHDPDSFGPSEAYTIVEAYLSATCAFRARCLRATLDIDDDSMTLAMDDHEEVIDDFRGANMRWSKIKVLPRANTIVAHGHTDERRMYRLTFHRRHRRLVEDAYLPHVLAKGRDVIASRQRCLHTNKPKDDWDGDYDGWSSVKFEHPSTFSTLAMDPTKKQEILDDLEMFRDGKEYYACRGNVAKT